MKTFHQPLDFTSPSGRKELISRPAVGTVHSRAMTSATAEAQRLLSAPAAAELALLGLPAGVGCGGAVGVVVVIGPPACASDGRCR